eukprot:gene4969-5617_t
MDSSESAVLADGIIVDNDVDSRKYVQEAKNESNVSQEQPTTMQVEKRSISVETCASVLDDVVSAVFEQVVETAHGKLDKDACDAEGSCSDVLESCAQEGPVVSNTNVDSVIQVVSSESAGLADGIGVVDEGDSRKHVQEAKNESNVSQEQPTTMQVEERSISVETCASVLDDVVSAVCEQVVETAHGKLDKDACDAEGSCSDVLESCAQEGPVVSNTNVDSVIQVVSSESAGFADGIGVVDESDSRKHVQEAKKTSNVSQQKPTTLQVKKKAVIVETCASVIDDVARAVFEHFTETPHGKLEKDGCDAEGSYSDALGSCVKVEPVVSNSNVDSVIQMDSSESAVLADGISVDNDVDSRKYVQEAKNESNVSQEQPTTMQVEERSISVETCATVLDDVVSAIFEQFAETGHVVSSESAVLADGIGVVDEGDSRKHVQEAKKASNVSQQQPTTLQAAEKAIIVETCTSVLNDIVSAVFEQFTETPDGKLDKNACDAVGDGFDFLVPTPSTCTCESFNTRDYFDNKESFMEPETVLARFSLSEDNFEDEESVEAHWEYALESFPKDRTTE